MQGESAATNLRRHAAVWMYGRRGQLVDLNPVGFESAVQGIHRPMYPGTFISIRRAATLPLGWHSRVSLPGIPPALGNPLVCGVRRISGCMVACEPLAFASLWNRNFQLLCLRDPDAMSNRRCRELTGGWGVLRRLNRHAIVQPATELEWPFAIKPSDTPQGQLSATTVAVMAPEASDLMQLGSGVLLPIEDSPGPPFTVTGSNDASTRSADPDAGGGDPWGGGSGKGAGCLGHCRFADAEVVPPRSALRPRCVCGRWHLAETCATRHGIGSSAHPRPNH